MKPRWQKAKLIFVKANEEDIGRELWVKIDRPRAGWVQYANGMTGVEDNLLRTNLIHGHRSISTPTYTLELLARGPEDFAEEVPLIEYAQWKKQAEVLS